jgi:hypothetical protein
MAKPIGVVLLHMARKVKLNELDAVLGDLEYPIDRETVEAECSDVTIKLADGEADFSAVLSSSSDQTFDSPDELTEELLSLLPRAAVGEPYQAEGEG